MKKRFKIDFDMIKIILSIVLFTIALFFKNNNIAYLTLLIISYVIVAYEIYIEAIKNIFKGEIFDENFLMIIATIGAFFIKEYPEAVMVMLLFELGEYLSDLAIDNSKEAITSLMDLRSDKINLKINDNIITKDIEEAKLGDLFIVKPGEKIPLDGIVVEGNSSIDTSSLTGESMPKDVKINDSVLSGTINLTSVLLIKATSIFKTSTANKIIELIENSNDKKTKTERLITRFSKIYTPIVVISAILLIIIPTLLFKQDFNTWLYRSLQLLVISCPCALVISVPLAYFCGIGRNSKEGVLIKGSNELEKLTKIKNFIFDKTGTITKGNFKVNKIVTKNISEEQLVELSAYGEYYSNHPIAMAIKNKYAKVIDTSRITSYKEISGLGIECLIDGEEVYLGSAKLLSKHKISIEENNEVGSIIYIAKKETFLGYLLISDTIKEEAYTLKNNLNKLGIEKVIMLSGDDKDIVSKVANEINFDEYYSSLLPIDKVNKINEFKDKGFSAFIGDGINDVPVIKVADLGIAVGGIGNDATMEASDIVLLKDNLNNIIKAIKIANLTKKITIFNICFAISFKLIMMILAIFDITSIWMAVFSDVGITLLLVLHSLTIMKRKIHC